MGTAAGMLASKGRSGEKVHTVLADVTTLDAARLMNDKHIGALVVTDEDDHIMGIFTERDLLKRVVAAERNPATTYVGDVMTSEVFACRNETSLEELRLLMREKHIRHVPVVDDKGRVLGMISIGDLNLAETRELSDTIVYLEQYMTRM